MCNVEIPSLKRITMQNMQISKCATIVMLIWILQLNSSFLDLLNELLSLLMKMEKFQNGWPQKDLLGLLYFWWHGLIDGCLITKLERQPTTSKRAFLSIHLSKTLFQILIPALRVGQNLNPRSLPQKWPAGNDLESFEW